MRLTHWIFTEEGENKKHYAGKWKEGICEWGRGKLSN